MGSGVMFGFPGMDGERLPLCDFQAQVWWCGVVHGGMLGRYVGGVGARNDTYRTAGHRVERWTADRWRGPGERRMVSLTLTS